MKKRNEQNELLNIIHQLESRFETYKKETDNKINALQEQMNLLSDRGGIDIVHDGNDGGENVNGADNGGSSDDDGGDNNGAGSDDD